MRVWKRPVSWFVILIAALAGCYGNRTAPQPLRLGAKVTVDLPTPTELTAVRGGDSITVSGITSLVGQVDRVSNDTLFLVVAEYRDSVMRSADPADGPPAIGATMIVPLRGGTQVMRRAFSPGRTASGVITIVGVAFILLLAWFEWGFHQET